MANEKRLIDANKLSEQMAATFEQCAYEGVESAECQIALDTISEAPTVDAVEVVHGQWEDFCRGKMCCCSVCKAEFDNTCNEIHDEWHYCPNCGAKMDGGADNG